MTAKPTSEQIEQQRRLLQEIMGDVPVKISPFRVKIGIFDDERVTILMEDKERFEIWIPSRQEDVWVKREKVNVIDL